MNFELSRIRRRFCSASDPIIPGSAIAYHSFEAWRLTDLHIADVVRRVSASLIRVRGNDFVFMEYYSSAWINMVPVAVNKGALRAI